MVDANNNLIRKDLVNGDKIIGTRNSDGMGTNRLEITFNEQARSGCVQQIRARFASKPLAARSPTIASCRLRSQMEKERQVRR